MLLPTIYWLPKLHETPPKARYIIAAPECSWKLLPKAISSVLQLWYHQIETYKKEGNFFSGVKFSWTMQNNEPIINH